MKLMKKKDKVELSVSVTLFIEILIFDTFFGSKTDIQTDRQNEQSMNLEMLGHRFKYQQIRRFFC